jgi:hypothetical protein
MAAITTIATTAMIATSINHGRSVSLAECEPASPAAKRTSARIPAATTTVARPRSRNRSGRRSASLTLRTYQCSTAATQVSGQSSRVTIARCAPVARLRRQPGAYLAGR